MKSPHLILRRYILQHIVLLSTLCISSFSFSQNIKRFEYFIDSDPGYGLGTIATPASAPSVTDFPISIPVTSLSPGFHRIFIRTQDTNNMWTQTLTFPFFIAVSDPSAGTINAIEYFIDNDPGFNLGTSVSITPSATLTNVAIDLSAATLTEGFHKIFVRSKNASNIWSEARYSIFYVAKVLPPENIVKFEYYFDTDPGYDNGTAAPVAPPSPTVVDQTIMAVPSSLSPGTHTIYVRAKDNVGDWTSVISQVFVVGPPVCLAGTPTVTNGSGCYNTPISTSASGATGTQEYRWYNVSTGGSSLANTATYSPVLTASATYYVSIYDAINNCEGTRSSVTATVNPLPNKPSIVAGGSLTFCPGGSVTLTASSGYNGYIWSDGNTTVSRSVSSAATLSVQVTDALGCKSISSDPVTVSLFTPPAKPVITGSTDICNGKTITLSGPAGFTYAWSTGAITSSITVNTQSTVTLIVKDANGCASVPSNPAIVACTNIAPVITTTSVQTTVESTVTIDLSKLISDVDNNIDLSTLSISSPPISGAKATIDGNARLNIDYKGISFSGTDRLSISVCDIDAACATKELSINVEGDIVIYNAVSPNGDSQNEIFFIQYIDILKDTQSNNVAIFNRWGDIVFSVDNYNNTTHVFRGLNNNGDALASGTYYYRITFPGGRKEVTGFLEVRK